MTFLFPGWGEQGSENWREKIKATGFEYPCPPFFTPAAKLPNFQKPCRTVLIMESSEHIQHLIISMLLTRNQGESWHSLYVSLGICLFHIAPYKEQSLGVEVSSFEWHWSWIIFFFWFGCFFAIYFQSWVADYRAFAHLLTCLSQPVSFQEYLHWESACWDFQQRIITNLSHCPHFFLVLFLSLSPTTISILTKMSMKTEIKKEQWYGFRSQLSVGKQKKTVFFHIRYSVNRC